MVRGRSRGMLGVVSGLALAAALSGCVPTPAETVFVTAAPAPAETVYVTVTPTPPAAPGAGAPGADPLVPNAPAPEVQEGPAVDSGPRTGALGTATTDASGEPERYTVVAGDSFFDIAQRFDLPQQQLLRMNPSIHDFGETVYIGQVVNLDWQSTL
ncbi:LysM domain-containing protein [Herbiconiux sp. L3-i23]|uniref:LysM peptidoglycan-binding domain-containing protein n=1 Tax=Herbiconiux sp. L3-i23 TaxID=2905871 RepID=UPI002072ECED|nr:LysM domain-containing protein [Herbiconiux sp. L3-i23]